ncbi:MAG: hypothetical protein ASARMPRED_007205 [Alectoria sarmentosa]|nr:MAG: hypothetical protein ASARMPRED_007205 [Alectoria sarmentosa]
MATDAQALLLDMAVGHDAVGFIGEKQREAHLFAKKAKQSLHTTEFERLQDFLYTPPETYNLEELHRQVLEQFRTFYAAEILESGEPSDRLAAPSGPEIAQLGFVMHCQSQEGEIGELWDIESCSIQTLAEKS